MDRYLRWAYAEAANVVARHAEKSSRHASHLYLKIWQSKGPEKRGRGEPTSGGGYMVEAHDGGTLVGAALPGAERSEGGVHATLKHGLKGAR